MKIVREMPRNNVANVLITNAISTCLKHGILVTKLDRAIEDRAFIVTAPHMGLTASCATFDGVQDLIIRSAGRFQPADAYTKKWRKYHAQHYRVLRMMNGSPEFAKEHSRVFYDERKRVVCDHRIPWKYYDAMQRSDRGARP